MSKTIARPGIVINLVNPINYAVRRITVVVPTETGFACGNCSRPIVKEVAEGHSLFECPDCKAEVKPNNCDYPIFCSSCGKVAQEGNYCPKCGTKLHD